MKTIHRTSAAALGGLLLLGTAACGSSYDREEQIRDFQEEQGLTEEQAVCVVDRLEEEIGVDRLGERGGEPTAEEAEAAVNAMTECLLNS